MSVALTPDGLKGISGSSDNTVRVWDLNSALIPEANRQSLELNCTGLVLDGCTGLSENNLSLLRSGGAKGTPSSSIVMRKGQQPEATDNLEKSEHGKKSAAGRNPQSSAGRPSKPLPPIPPTRPKKTPAAVAVIKDQSKESDAAKATLPR